MDQQDKNDKNEEFAFIKEKIKDKPVNKRRLLRKSLWAVCSGLLFGLAACVAFVWAKPYLEERMDPQESGETVTFPGDQPPGEEAEEGTEDTTGDGEDPTQAEEGQEDDQVPQDTAQEDPAQEEQEPVYVERELEAEDYQILQDKLYAIGKKGNKSVVTVTGVTSNTDWFDSAYESENQGSGIIVANNGQELLILTEKKVISDAEAISITFVDDGVVEAELKKYDGNTGIAILSVKLEDIPEETMDKIEVAVLGNSLVVSQGTAVIAIGSPLEANYSILTGTVTSSGNTVSTWDSTYTVFTTDIVGSDKGSGVLINLNGEVIGLIMQDYSSQGDRNTITALSISEVKTVIEALSNGMAIPYLGLKVSTVTQEIEETYGLPQGVYVRNVETDAPSPAMEAGLQEGDVIVEMNGEEVKTMEQYTRVLMSLNPEQTIKLVVLRQNGGEYAQLECTAVVGVLK